jgi:SET domain-containing protein
LLEVAIPLDEGPNRGLSVFANKDIPQYTVVCPYAGVLHSNEQSLEASIRKNGSQPVLSYLFATRSSHRVVDAVNTGNVASLVNTSQLGDQTAFKENNVIPIVFGKNLVFYIVLRDLKKGEELLIDYGPTYNPSKRLAVKQEECAYTPKESES